MARPVFIVCSSSRSVDQATNQLSIFDVLEGLEIAIPLDGAPHIPKVEDLARMTGQTFACTSFWMRDEEDDPDTEYQHQVRVTRTDGETATVSEGKFKFTKHFQRILGTFAVTVSSSTQSGIVWIENRIRPMGGNEWISQAYPIRVTVKRTEDDSQSNE